MNALPAVWRGMLWVALSGLFFSLLNSVVRQMTLSLHPFQAQLMRYLFGIMAMLPVLWQHGWRNYRPVSLHDQFWRGAVHTLGLMLWFTALPHIGLADMTAIGFTGPIFIMLGAALFLGERMRGDRWLAAVIGLAGVLGSVGHYYLTRGFRAADVSATQSLRFLDLIWASLLGWWLFFDVPSQTTVLGAWVILLSAIWIARREHRR